MKHVTPGLYVIVVCLLVISSCEDPSIDPGPFAYPMQITVDQQDHAVHLSWSQIDVSTFEEYIVLRSLDSIPDTPEPEITGFTTVIKRLDERNVPEFEDFQLPIESKLFYKVYAKIGDRFLMTPTIHVDLSYQLIDFRADMMTVDTIQNELIGFDRTRRLLFTYNYVTEEVVSTGLFNHNTPIIRFGNYAGNDEIYLCDRNSIITVIDRESMTILESINTTYTVIDFQVVDNFIIATRSDNRIAVFDRATLQLRSSTPSVIVNQRLVAAAKINGELNAWELSLTQVAKYTIIGTTITRDDLRNIVVSGTSPIHSPKPGYDAFAMTNFGQIMDADLESVTVLEEGSQFYQTMTYDPTGRYLFTSGFGLNTPEIKTFDVNTGYQRVKRHPFSFTPVSMFADVGALHAISVQFVNGAARTLIAKISYE